MIDPEIAELKQLFREIAEMQKETSEQMKKTDEFFKNLFKETELQFKETDRIIKETSEQMKKTDEQMNRTDERMNKTDAKLDKLAKMYGNVSKNQGDVAEEFFYNTIKTNLKIGNLQFYDISLNMFKEKDGIKDEFDIVLTNGDSLAIIEVKYKAHENDVEKIKDKKISNFRKLYPIYKDYKIYAGIAGFHINDDVVNKAEEYGFFVLKRKGELVEFDTAFMKEQLAG